MDNLNKDLILVDKDDNITGTTKALNGHYKTSLKLHRAFSLFLTNTKGEMLMQQRSSKKLVFPLKWGNTICSHPFLNEMSFTDPIMDCKLHLIKRLEHELGITEVSVDDIKYVGRVLYKATDKETFGYLMEGNPTKQEIKHFELDILNEDIVREAKNFFEWEVDYIFICKKDVECKLNKDEVKDIKYVDKEEYMNMVNKGKVAFWTNLIIENSMMIDRLFQ